MRHSKFFSALPAAIFALFLLITLGTACNKDDDSKPNPYIGQWEIQFNGTCFGQQTVIINDNGSFAFSVNCDGPVFSVKGQVDLNTGAMSGALAWGPLGCSTALIGHINSNGTGSGTFDCLAVMTGGWIATKK